MFFIIFSKLRSCLFILHCLSVSLNRCKHLVINFCPHSIDFNACFDFMQYINECSWAHCTTCTLQAEMVAVENSYMWAISYRSIMALWVSGTTPWVTESYFTNFF